MCLYHVDKAHTNRYTAELTRASAYTGPWAEEVDDVLGGDEAWKNVDRTAVECPKCDHGYAYFMQIQIRSADEPMSTFFKCCKCGHQWRDG